MKTEAQESHGVFVATKVFPVAWRLDEALKELEAGNLGEVRYYLTEIRRELNISILHNRTMPTVPLEVQVAAMRGIGCTSPTTQERVEAMNREWAPPTRRA